MESTWHTVVTKNKSHRNDKIHLKESVDKNDRVRERVFKKTHIEREYDYTTNSLIVHAPNKDIVYSLKSGIALIDTEKEKICLVQIHCYDDDVHTIEDVSSKSKWGIPKGNVEPYEDVFQCAERELKEETGIVLSITADYPFIKINNTYYFLVHANSELVTPRVQNRSEILDCAWVSYRDIGSHMNINNETKRLVKKKWNLAIKLLMQHSSLFQNKIVDDNQVQ